MPNRTTLRTIALFTVFACAFVAVWFAMRPPSFTLNQRIFAAHAELERARTEHGVTYNVARTLAPLPEVDDPDDRKALFVAKMLVLIAEENERILAHRQIIESVPVDHFAYRAIAVSYGLAPDTARQDVLKRVDIIPESLCLAQGAIESAWGTSRFARKGHAYFGERTYSRDVEGISPKRADGFKVKAFPSPAHSVRSFMMTLNSHRAYRDFRRQRALLHSQGIRASGEDLAPYLGAYSEIGQKYIQRILITMRANALSDFDGIDHVDH